MAFSPDFDEETVAEVTKHCDSQRTRKRICNFS